MRLRRRDVFEATAGPADLPARIVVTRKQGRHSNTRGGLVRTVRMLPCAQG